MLPCRKPRGIWRASPSENLRKPPETLGNPRKPSETLAGNPDGSAGGNPCSRAESFEEFGVRRHPGASGTPGNHRQTIGNPCQRTPETPMPTRRRRHCRRPAHHAARPPPPPSPPPPPARSLARPAIRPPARSPARPPACLPAHARPPARPPAQRSPARSPARPPARSPPPAASAVAAATAAADTRRRRRCCDRRARHTLRWLPCDTTHHAQHAVCVTFAISQELGQWLTYSNNMLFTD